VKIFILLLIFCAASGCAGNAKVDSDGIADGGNIEVRIGGTHITKLDEKDYERITTLKVDIESYIYEKLEYHFEGRYQSLERKQAVDKIIQQIKLLEKRVNKEYEISKYLKLCTQDIWEEISHLFYILPSIIRHNDDDRKYGSYRYLKPEQRRSLVSILDIYFDTIYLLMRNNIKSKNCRCKEGSVIESDAKIWGFEVNSLECTQL